MLSLRHIQLRMPRPILSLYCQTLCTSFKLVDSKYDCGQHQKSLTFLGNGQPQACQVQARRLILTENEQPPSTKNFFELKTLSVWALGDKYDIVCAHAGPDDGEVIIAVHGSPASHKGFQNMAERLVAEGYQVFVPNFPGMGWSPIPTSSKYNFSFGHKAEILNGIIKALQFKRILMLCGHSMGVHTILRLADIPSALQMCKSVCFISSLGLRPHRLAAPWPLKRVIFRSFYNLCQVPFIGPAVIQLTSPFFVAAGLKGKTKVSQINSAIEASWFDWETVTANAATFRELGIPVLKFHGDKDRIAQFEIAKEMVRILGIAEDDVVWYNNGGRSGKEFTDDVLHRAVFIQGGDHSIFANRTDVISPEQLSFLKSVQEREDISDGN